MENILIATIKKWNIKNFYKIQKKFKNKYNFYLITNKDDLTFENIKKINPKYIFFPHWSWIIEDKIYQNFECIVFHMTDLPFGRGGSPLQNLIIREIYKTKISALRVAKELDGGDIYVKKNLDISKGSAKEIFEKSSNIIFKKIIPKILNKKINPKKQKGEITTFKRRTPNQSDLNSLNIKSITKIYDIIRMLDAQDYPKAFVKLNDFKIEFSKVRIKNDKLIGKFEVKKDE